MEYINQEILGQMVQSTLHSVQSLPEQISPMKSSYPMKKELYGGMLIVTGRELAFMEPLSSCLLLEQHIHFLCLMKRRALCLVQLHTGLVKYVQYSIMH